MLKTAAFIAGLAATAITRPARSDELSMRLDQPLELRMATTYAPTAPGRVALLDQLLPTTISLIDESGGFAESDREWISVLGESASRTRWSIDGLDVSSPMEQGASLVRLPRVLTGTIAVRGPETGGPVIDERPGRPSVLARAYAQKGSVLGMAPFANAVLEAFSGKHAVDRGIAPSTDRRFRDAFGVELGRELALFGRPGAMAVEARGDVRSFPGLGTGAFEDKNLALDAAVLASTDVGRLRLITSLRDRSHVAAELGRSAAETARVRSLAIFGSLITDELSFGAAVGAAGVELPGVGRTRPLEDLDGQGRLPSIAPGAVTSVVFDVKAGGGAGPYGELLVHGFGRSSSSESWSEELHSLGAPYGRYELEAHSTFVSTGSLRAGARASVGREAVGREAGVEFDGYFLASYALNDSGANTLIFPDVGAALRAYASVGPIESYVVLRRDPIAPWDSLAQALDPAGLSRTELVDGVGRIRREGGRFTRVDPAIRSPVSWVGSAGLVANVAESFSFELAGSVRRLEALPEIVLDGPKDVYGSTIDGVFYFRPGNETRWLLRSSRRGATYAGGHFQARTRHIGDFVFALSFSAFTSVGYPPLGNGPDTNDVFAPLPRDPNAETFGLASLDADRAFITKLWVAGRILGEGPIEDQRGLFASVALSHRDGQPFAFLDRHEYEGQVAFTLASNRGSPLSYSRPMLGPREDFQLTADISLTYGFELASVPLAATLFVTNAFDLGSEVAEGQDPERRRERAALELSVPRALLLSLALRR